MQVLSEFRRHSIEQVGETVNRHQVRAEGNFVYARGGEKDRLFLLVQLPGVEVVVGFGVLFDDRLMLVPLQDTFQLLEDGVEVVVGRHGSFPGEREPSCFLRNCPTHQFVRRKLMILELAGLFDACNRQQGLVKQPDLHQNRRLIPIDAFASDLIPLELHHDHHWNFDLPMSGLNARQNPIHYDVVSEGKHKLVNQPILPHCPGQ